MNIFKIVSNMPVVNIGCAIALINVATIAANDVNGAWSGGYGVVALRAVARQRVARWDISEFANCSGMGSTR